MVEPWTIRRLLAWTAEDFGKRGLDSPRLDAEILLAQALGVTRMALYLDLDRPLGDEELARYRGLVSRRRAREPVAYILGRREFYGRDFICGAGTLVPRPETETLVERALDALPADATGPALDLCTGTGAVGLTLAAERSALRVELTDVSPLALESARRNTTALGLEGRVQVHQGDLFQALPVPRRFPLITANPPYVPAAEVDRLMPEVARHEPRLALAAGPDGLDVVRRLLAGARAHLEPGGRLLVEIGHGQDEAVEAIARETPGLVGFRAHLDLGGVPRVVEVARDPADPVEAPAPPDAAAVDPGEPEP